MAQLCVDLNFRKGPVEVLLSLLEGAARSQLDDLNRIVFSVFMTSDLVDLGKSARTDDPLILKIGLKALS